MRPIAEYSIEQMKLCVSKLIITYYLRYTLVRCATFTNTRAEAERITFYALVATCLLARELRSLRQLDWEAIGRELGRSPEAARKLWTRAIRRLGEQIEGRLR